ncbi:helix-turn-helix transcriptional regulator [Rariglobus hedericola]|uniref:Helix-turn-helix transcriptional regulator n=2 Tax=Rariglobus hedericola TaxID=2597822 RepID=A0A556QSU4_9BACT|nr:helix-turn-helix transcriptional regulator [Rariglobus hedericola]
MCANLGVRVRACVTAQLQRWTFPNLAAPYWRLYLMEGPGAEVSWKGKRIMLSPESAWLIAPDTPFGTALRNPATQCYVHFTLAPGVLVAPGIYEVPLSQEMRRWHGCAVSARTSEAGGIAWLALILGALDYLPLGSLSERQIDPRVQRALEHMERDLGAPHTLESLAVVAGMHGRALIRLFRKETSDTPMACLRARRISTACELLHHGDRKIDDIATAVGFCDRYHFTKTFRKFREITPAAFRALRQGLQQME